MIKKLFFLGLAFTSLITTQTAWSALSPADLALIGRNNLLLNPGFESGKASWTTTTATPALETSTILGGKQSIKLTFSSSTGDTAQSATPTTNTLSTNMEASCWVNTTMATIQVCALSGGTETNCQNVPASGTWQPVTSTMIGPSNGTSVGVRVKTSASGSGTVYVDDCYVGAARNLAQISQANFVGSAFFANNSSCNWVRTGTSIGAFSTTAACPGPTVEQNPGPGVIQTTDTDLPKVTVNSLPPGQYTVVFTGNAQQNTTSGINSLTISDGTTTSGDSSGASVAGSSASFSIVGNFSYTTTQNVTFEVQGSASTGSIRLNATDNNNLHFAIYKYPSQQQAGFRPDATPANWTGYQDGVSGGCSTTSTTYADPSACTSVATTALTSINMTCTQAASSAPGITCVIPRAGHYKIKAKTNLSATAALIASVRLTDGSGAVIDRGTSQYIGTAAKVASVPLSGDYNAAASGSVTFKVQLATDTSTVAITNGTAASSAAIQWEVLEEDAPMPSPYLVQGVSSSTTGQEHIERARLAAPSAGTCAITSQSGSWISGTPTSSGTGICNVTIATGEFSDTPACTCVAEAVAPANRACSILPTSATAISIGTILATTAAGANSPISVVCMGPR